MVNLILLWKISELIILSAPIGINRMVIDGMQYQLVKTSSI